MGFSPLATMSKRIPDGGRSHARNSTIKGVTIHHQAGVNAHGEATNPNREVSATYWIMNDGTIIPNIDENRRAFTTGHINYPAGAQSDHRNITVEVSNSPEGVKSGTWATSAAAMKSLINLIADVFKRHKLGTISRGKNGGIAVHQDFVATSCPGPYIMDRLGSIISEAEKVRSSGKAPSLPKPGGGGGGSSKTVSQMAAEVVAGKHGNGHATRRASLGVSASVYEQVRAEVNRRVGATSSPSKPAGKTVAQMAAEVLAGKHGNGHANRRTSLGVSAATYEQVRAEVNRRVGATPTKPAGKSIAQMASEVIRGDHGNGHANRQRSLGVNNATYQRVRAEVNRRV